MAQSQGMNGRSLSRSRIALLGLALLICACSRPSGPTPTTQAGPSQAASATPSPVPTPTRTQGPPITLLILPSDTSAEFAQQAQRTIGDLAQSAGTVLQVQPELRPADLPDDLAFLILLSPPPDEDLAASLAQAPAARIVAPAAGGATARPGLTLLQSPQNSDLRQAFLAGYTAALITEDYRAAILLDSANDTSSAEADSFRAGAEYYCGLCRPVRPPFEDYPLTLTDAAGSGSVASLASESGVETVFFPTDLAGSPAIADLSASGLTVLGTSPPPPDLVQRWAASFLPSPMSAIQTAWPDIISDAPPVAVTMPIEAQYVNDTLISPGRLRLVVRTQQDMTLGLIDIAGGP